MKKISFILLLISALFNRSNSMEKLKNAYKANPAMAAAVRLQAKPILFFNYSVLYTKSTEWIYLNNLIGSSYEKRDKCGNEQEAQILYDQIKEAHIELENIENKVKKIFQSVCKKYDASAILVSSGYVDPSYDITQEVIDTLNKEYETSQSKKPTCNHGCDVHCPTKCNMHCPNNH